MRLFVTLFEAPYMQRALVEMILLGVMTGVVGVYVVLRRLAFVADAFTHTVFPGVALAAVWGQPLVSGALVFGVLSAFILSGFAANRRLGFDTSLAVVLTTFFSFGVLLVSHRPGYTADLTALLFGRVLAIDAGDLAVTGALTAVALIVLAAMHKELILRAFDPEGAAAAGYRVAVIDLVLNLIIALVVVAALKAVGTILVLALLVTPAAAARLVSDRVAVMLGFSVAVALVAGWLGLATSYELSVHHGARLASGATIVVVLTLIFFVFLAVSPRTGLLRWVTGGRSRS